MDQGQQLFTLALGLVPPWAVDDARFTVDDKRLDQLVNFPRDRLTFLEIFTIQNHHQGATLLKAWMDNAKASGLLHWSSFLALRHFEWVRRYDCLVERSASRGDLWTKGISCSRWHWA